MGTEVGGRTLQGKAAIITGAATGIGRATAILFARAGARLTVADTRADELERTVAQVKDAGGEAVAVTADLARPEDCAKVVAAAIETAGRLDVVFNNAGVGTMVVGGTVETIELYKWDLALDVNVRAMYLVSRAAIPALRRAGGGSIINVASIYGPVGAPHYVAYTASKGAVIAMTKVAALEHAHEAIRVNAICPGPVRSPMSGSGLEGINVDLP
jgi:NAD(P)-dependent dehydrogenase (short-subunit alcohol dehydrogenase family)